MSNLEFIQDTLTKIDPINEDCMAKAKGRLDSLTKPLGSLGRLEELAQRICAITRKERPSLENKVIFTLAADHGITQEGVSAYPSEVTTQMVFNFLRGGAGINVLARAVQARVIVVDMGVAADFNDTKGLIHSKIRKGTDNFAKGPAMSREEAESTIAAGIRLLEKELQNGVDIVGTGDMGIGNTTPSSAIVSVMTGKSVAHVTGQGAGIEAGALSHKVQVIEAALALNQPDPSDPIDVLAKVGGFEIGGLAGIIVGAAKNKIPVMLDGFISGAAALIASGLNPTIKDYLIAAHRSAEPGHDAMLKHLGLSPLLDLKMRLGEGTGAALGMSLAEAACRILNEMATFEEAKVSGKKEAAVEEI